MAEFLSVYDALEDTVENIHASLDVSVSMVCG
jgi:hypothetical protein